MGFFDKIKQGLDASFADAGPSEELLASLTPEQRAAYDANMARVAEAEAQVRGNHLRLTDEHAARVAQRPLRGPAGDHLYGPVAYPGADPSELLHMSAAEQLEHSMQLSKQQLTDVLKNPFGRKKPPMPDAARTSDGAPPPRPRSPQEEWAARREARRPYLATPQPRTALTRIATRGKHQVEEVAEHLASSGLAGRPDLVYGVYRVPDRISPGMGSSEKGRIVEWDIVHAATEPLPQAPKPTVRWFDGDAQWVARRAGEPSVLDEDLALAYLASAGLGPEHVLGVARHLTIRSHGGGDEGSSSVMWSRVDGVLAFHTAGAGDDVHEQMLAARPLRIATGSPPGAHVEVLNWGAVAQAVHPDRHKPPAHPSPFPYLPSTPQELLQAYLEVVGVQPADSYGVQVTTDEPCDIQGWGSTAGGLISFTTNVGVEQPCADGKARRRLAGAHLVVLTYRDRHEYQAGRERWRAYEDHQLQATLANGTGARRPVAEPPNRDLPRVLRGVLKVAEVIDAVVDPSDGSHPDEAPHRYCWPPIPV